MPPTKKPKKIWNDDLVTALRARQELARQAGKQSSITWQQGADAVEAIRQDIYIFSTGRIVGFPPPKPLSKTVDALCRQVMAGTAPILPDGYIPCNFEEQHQQQQRLAEHENPYDNHHYNKSIKIRGGAFAILMAFYCSGLDHGIGGGSISVTKSQLIRAAQPFCDEAMEGNFHAGRPHGAWKGHETLKKHNLITVQNARVTYHQRAGGMRALPGSQNTYTLTRQGELFIQALLKRHPEIIQHQINSVRQGAATAGGGAGVHRPFAAARAGGGTAARQNAAAAAASTTTTTATPVKNKYSESDGQRLLEWIQTATIGQQKEFCGLGKERRKYLHNLCDELSSSRDFVLQGKVLIHESSGTTARSRLLTITLEQQRPQSAAAAVPRVFNPYAKPAPVAAAVVSPPPRATATSTFSSTSSSESPLWQNDISPFAAAAAAAASEDHYHDGDDYGDFDHSFSSSMSGGGNILNDSIASTTPTKRKIPPSEAAAEAAELRRALFESARLATQQGNNKAKKTVKSCTNAATAPPFIASTMNNATNKRRLLHSVKSENEMDSKMPAKTTTTAAQDQESKKNNNSGTTTRPDILELLESDDDDDELLNSGPMFHKRPAEKKKTAVATTITTTKSSSNKIDSSIIDLTESSPLPAVPAAAAAAMPTRDKDEHDDDLLHHHVNHRQDVGNMTILIDNRERTRNCKPRYLRTELGRLLASGPLALAWPQNIIPKPAVEERALVHGDFCFELHKQQDVAVPVDKGTEAATATTALIPVCIERKRIADLVQRSASRDHWNQLQRMRDRAVVSIFLLEGDFRIAGTSVMPFSNNSNRDGGGEWSANSHVIEDEEGILRFIARAILSTGLVRFIQTKDEQESLRAVAATGLVSATSNRVRQRRRQQKQRGTPFSNTTMTSVQDEQTRLSDRLQVGGIPWQLAKSISQEIGSIPQMDRLYKSAKDKDCQSQLLIPVIQESCGALQSESSASSWSAAIRQVYFSTLSEPTAGKKAYRAHEHLVTNHAALLEQFHSGERITPEEALDTALSASPKPDLKRKVSICLPEAFLDVLPSAPAGAADDDDMLDHLAGNDETFYTAMINTALTPLPTIVLQTKDDCYQSEPVFVCIIEGQDITERLRFSMTTATTTTPSASTCNGLEAARKVAKKIHEECITSCNASWRVIGHQEKQQTRQTIVLIVRGLRPAFDRLAKGGGGGYLAEIRAVMDMVLAEVMISYNVVVLQAIRKTCDLERMVQEFALACFHFQLLTEKKKVIDE